MKKVDIKPCLGKKIVAPVISAVQFVFWFWLLYFVCSFIPLAAIIDEMSEPLPYLAYLKYIGQYYVIVALLISVFSIFVDIVSYQFMHPVIEDDYIVDKFGIFWKTEKNIPYHKLTDATVTQGPIEKIFGFANIRLQTAGSSGVEAVLIGVADYKEAQKIIRGKIKETRIDNFNAPDKEEGGVLQQILETLREINSKLK